MEGQLVMAYQITGRAPWPATRPGTVGPSAGPRGRLGKLAHLAVRPAGWPGAATAGQRGSR
jgi:hypothetical protein